MPEVQMSLAQCEEMLGPNRDRYVMAREIAPVASTVVTDALHPDGAGNLVEIRKPDNVDRRRGCWATVLGAGPGITSDFGVFRPTIYRAGDRVMLSFFSGIEIDVELSPGEFATIALVREDEILCLDRRQRRKIDLLEEMERLATATSPAEYMSSTNAAEPQAPSALAITEAAEEEEEES